MLLQIAPRALPLSWLLVATVLLHAPDARAVDLTFEVDITKALAGNPVGAVIGTSIPAGTGSTGATDPIEVGGDTVALRADTSGPGAFLNLVIGTKTFTDPDDIQFTLQNDVPAAEFEDDVYTALDYVLLFEIVAGEPVSKVFNPDALGQDTSGFVSTPHYWMDFDSGDGSFAMGLVTGFEVVANPPGADSLDPLFAQGTLVEGTLREAALAVPLLPPIALLGLAGCLIAVTSLSRMRPGHA